MSILIADSGASKTTWVLCEETDILAEVGSIGMNPNAVSIELIAEALETLQEELSLHESPTHLYFYGSGMNNPLAKAKLFGIFQQVFADTEIVIENDLLAAARSTGRTEGLVGILGTGSIACHYREGTIIEQRGGHGYLIGDEGSGQDLGRHLMHGLLNDSLPPSLAAHVLEQEQTSPRELRTALYESERPSAFLAKLAKYLYPFRSQEVVRNMIAERFGLFLHTTILPLAAARQLPLDMVGSVAYYFEEIWKEACNSERITIGEMIQNPMKGLIQYHQQNGNLRDLK